jgi:uncharacterized protein YndB with AHSA1/START domain
MRYADGPTAEATVHIAAPPETVWRFVSDIHFLASLSQEVQAVEWVEGEPTPGTDPPALGCRFLGHNHHPAAGEWTTPNHIVSCDPPRAFGWDTGHAESPAASWRFELTPRAGGTDLRQWVRMGPGWSNLVRLIESMPEKEERIVERRMSEFRAGLESNVAAIKQIAEKETAGQP